MRNKRNVQINVCLTQGEVRRLRQRARRETEGNVSRLVREALFPAAAQTAGEQVPDAVPLWNRCIYCGGTRVNGGCHNNDCILYEGAKWQAAREQSDAVSNAGEEV